MKMLKFLLFFAVSITIFSTNASSDVIYDDLICHRRNIPEDRYSKNEGAGFSMLHFFNNAPQDYQLKIFRSVSDVAHNYYLNVPQNSDRKIVLPSIQVCNYSRSYYHDHSYPFSIIGTKNGKKLETKEMYTLSSSSYYYYDNRKILIGKYYYNLIESNKDHINSMLNGRSNSIVLAATEEDPSQVTRGWFEYSSYCATVLHHEDYDSMSETARQELIDYVALGGRLIIVGTPKNKKEIYLDWGNDNKELYEFSFNKTDSQNNTSCLIKGNILPVGVGRCYILDAEFNKVFIEHNGEVTKAQFRAEFFADAISSLLFDIDKKTLINKRYKSSCFKEEWFAKFFPKTTLSLILIAFAIIVGPVSFIWLGRKQKRVVMLVTTPLIAFAVICLIFVLILLGDGISGKGHFREVKILNEKINKSYNINHSIYYFPFSPLQPLILDNNTSLFCSHAPRSVDFKDKMYINDFFKDRNQCNIFYKNKSNTKWRLKFNYEEGQLIVDNWFKKPIEKLYVVDEKGQYWYGEKIIAGASSYKLKKISKLPKEKEFGPRQFIKQGHNRSDFEKAVSLLCDSDKVLEKDEKVFEPEPWLLGYKGRYYVELDNSILEEPQLFNISKPTYNTVILGVSEDLQGKK